MRILLNIRPYRLVFEFVLWSPPVVAVLEAAGKGSIALQRRDAIDPGTHPRIGGKIEAALVRHVRISVERDVGDGRPGAHQPVLPGQGDRKSTRLNSSH